MSVMRSPEMRPTTAISTGRVVAVVIPLGVLLCVSCQIPVPLILYLGMEHTDTALFQVLATSGCNSVNCVSQ